MAKKRPTFTYKVLKFLLKLVYPKYKTSGTQHLPAEPCVFVGNHAQLHGPIACELYFPVQRYTWCAAEMMHFKEVPGYAFADFWSQKPKRSHWFYKIAARAIAPLSVCIFNNAQTIAVYHDARAIFAFKESVKKLQAGQSLVIFPERDAKHNHIVYDFQDRFIDVARLYYRKTGKALQFVPLYVAPKLHLLQLGQPVTFDPQAPIDAERERIRTTLMQSITALAEALPLHTVVPYRNIPKKLYPKNIPQKEHRPNEKANG